MLFVVSSLLSVSILSNMTSMNRLRSNLNSFRYKAFEPSPLPINVDAKSIRDDDCCLSVEDDEDEDEDDVAGGASSESFPSRSERSDDPAVNFEKVDKGAAAVALPAPSFGS